MRRAIPVRQMNSLNFNRCDILEGNFAASNSTTSKKGRNQRQADE